MSRSSLSFSSVVRPLGFILYQIMLVLIIHHPAFLNAACMVTSHELKKRKKGATLSTHIAAEISIKMMVQILSDQ